MAIDTRRGIAVSALNGLAVEAALVRCLLIGVTGRASDVLRRRLVGRALYVRVAVHTSKHAAVDGIFESLRIDVKAYRLSVNLVRQCGVAMAGEAFLDCGLGRVFLGRCLKRARR
jgi:hypothetical protein